MSDTRPIDCRFRQQDEGRAYPRSACKACGKTITTGLGRACTVNAATEIEALRRENQELRKALEPFAREGAGWNEKWPDDTPVASHPFGIGYAVCPASFTVGDLRRALTMSDIPREQLDRTRTEGRENDSP